VCDLRPDRLRKPQREALMTTDEYQVLAMRTEADQEAILERLKALGPQAVRLDNAARGLASEAGEVCDVVAKYVEFGRPLDRAALIEEVGGCLWRIAQICKAGGFTIEQAMEANVRQLRVRHPGKFDGAAGKDRDAERKAIVQDGHGFGHVQITEGLE